MTAPASNQGAPVERFRCSVAAASAPMAGSAGDESSFLLVEYPGPWGNKALAESRLPEQVRTGLAQGAKEAGVRVLFIRRHGRTTTESNSFRVFLGHASARDPWIETTLLGVAEDLLDLDLDGLAEGRPPGLDPHHEPLFLVCTNGRRDVCCAELGRPVVSAVAQAHPENTWEVTHLGGHRFASTMLTLPDGLSYGRLDPDSAVRIADLTLERRLDPAHLRGRAAYDAPVQATEIALLAELGESRIDALDLGAVSALDDGRQRVSFRRGDDRFTRLVTSVSGGPIRASCSAENAKPAQMFVVKAE